MVDTQQVMTYKAVQVSEMYTYGSCAASWISWSYEVLLDLREAFPQEPLVQWRRPVISCISFHKTCVRELLEGSNATGAPSALVLTCTSLYSQDLRRKLEMEILEHADVVCCTCVGAGDPRLQNFRFQHVSRLAWPPWVFRLCGYGVAGWCLCMCVARSCIDFPTACSFG